MPRNVGIQFARGKYISFLDSDDLYTKTALEELTTLAEKYQAEVIRINSYFILWNDNKKYADDPAFTNFAELVNPANRIIRSEVDPALFTEPTLISENTAERVKHFTNWGTFWSSILLFCRRDFLIANQIVFPAMLKSEDASFVLACFLRAKKFLRVPNITYIHRPRINSVSKIDDSNINVVDYLHKNVKPLIEGANELNKVMDNFNFFDRHPDYRYAVLDFFFQKSFSWLNPLLGIYAQIPAVTLQPLVEKEFHPDDATLAAYLFNTVNIQRLQIMRLQQELSKFQNR